MTDKHLFDAFRFRQTMHQLDSVFYIAFDALIANQFDATAGIDRDALQDITQWLALFIDIEGSRFYIEHLL